MGIVQRGGDRTEDAGDLADRQTRRIPPNQMSAIRALDIVHRDPQLALVLSGRPTLAAPLLCPALSVLDDPDNQDWTDNDRST